jgi:hypothetical protein
VTGQVIWPGQQKFRCSSGSLDLHYLRGGFGRVFTSENVGRGEGGNDWKETRINKKIIRVRLAFFNQGAVEIFPGRSG